MDHAALLPEASQSAHHIDVLFFSLTAASTAIVILVAGLIIGFSVHYRRGSKADRSALPKLLRREFETGWTLATLLAFLALFGWAAAQDFSLQRQPSDPMEVHVVAKQWMWKVQHEGGQREIDALHVPLDRPVRLVMNSQDVIHSFFVPAFRIKQDVVPGTTERLVFRAVETGTFRLMCAEYCGTRHSAMTGKIVVMKPEDYAAWLAEQPEGDALAERGEGLYTTLGCSGCHAQTGTIRAPDLRGVYGNPVPLSDGRIVTADDEYLRDSILEPRRDVVAGFQPIMPSFAGKVSEGDIVALLAWLRTNGDEGEQP